MALKCAQCGTENPNDAYFCSKCGAQVWSAFNQPAGPTNLAAADPGSMPAVSTPTPNLIPPPPTSAGGSSGFLIDKAATPPPASPPPATAYAPQEYSHYHTPMAAPVSSGYGYAPLPPDGNTSGMGTAYPAPAQSQGWTFAGCVPWGLFAFFNGNSTMGALGLVAQFFGLHIVYAIYMGIKGRELAWQGRRFDSVSQFEDTMKAWNRAGIIVTIVLAIFILLYFVVVFGLVFWAATNPDAMGTPSSTPPASSSSVSIQ
jgi:hypothetical protein